MDTAFDAAFSWPSHKDMQRLATKAAVLTFFLHLTPFGAGADYWSQGQKGEAVLAWAGDALFGLASLGKLSYKGVEIFGKGTQKAFHATNIVGQSGMAGYRAWEGVGKYQDGDTMGATGNAGEVLLRLIGIRYSVKQLKALRTVPPVSQATQTLTHKNGIYEVLSEQPITGVTRGTHRNIANRNLLQQLEADPQLNRQLSELLGVSDVAAHMRSGRGAIRNPLGTEWHHPIGFPDVIILLRRQVHRHRDLQDILHPGNIGGFGTHYGN